MTENLLDNEEESVRKAVVAYLVNTLSDHEVVNICNFYNLVVM